MTGVQECEVDSEQSTDNQVERGGGQSDVSSQVDLEGPKFGEDEPSQPVCVLPPINTIV